MLLPMPAGLWYSVWLPVPGLMAREVELHAVLSSAHPADTKRCMAASA